MAKGAVKTADQPALFAQMKDVTPKKGDDKKPDPKPAKAKSTAVTTAAAAKPPAIPKNLDTAQDFLALINRAASMSKVDVSVIRELLAMKDEQIEKIRVQEYNVAFHAARAEMPPIVKDGKAPTYKYPTLENVSRSIDGIARSHGFAHRFGTADSPIANHYRIICDLSHINGHKERHFMDLPADAVGQKGTVNKSPVQAVNSTFSIGRRYLKIAVWDLVIAGADTEETRRLAGAGNQAETRAELLAEDIADLKEKIRLAGISAGLTEEMFCTKYHISKVEDLAPGKYDDAVRSIQNHVTTYGNKK